MSKGRKPDWWSRSCRNCPEEHAQLCAICGGGHGPYTEIFELRPGVLVCYHCHNFHQRVSFAEMLFARAEWAVLSNFRRIQNGHANPGAVPLRLTAGQAMEASWDSLVNERGVYGPISQDDIKRAYARLVARYREVWRCEEPSVAPRAASVRRARTR